MIKFISFLLVFTLGSPLFAGAIFEKNTNKTKVTAPQDKISSLLLTIDTGIDDKSFNESIWRGFLKFYGDAWNEAPLHSSLYNVHTVINADEQIQTLEQYAQDNYDVIICSGYNWFDALSTVSLSYPDQKFSIIDASGLQRNNVSEYIFDENEGGYLVGLIAAAQAIDEGIENPQFGFIGGVRCDPLTRYETGYMQGIAQLIPDAVFYEYYTDSWNAPFFAEEKAHSWYNQGVYCIFPCAGATSIGAINSAKKMRYNGKNVWAIGADSDMYYDGVYKNNQSAILTSSLKQNKTASFDALQRVENNIWSPSTHTLNISNDGIDYSRSNIEMSHDAIAYAEKAKVEIESGTLIVYKNYEDALKNGVITNKFTIIKE